MDLSINVGDQFEWTDGSGEWFEVIGIQGPKAAIRAHERRTTDRTATINALMREVADHQIKRIKEPTTDDLEKIWA